MIVRCGKCRIELEVPGPGEFVCPSCGTRNAVRNGGPPASPFGLPDLGARTGPPQPEQPPAGVSWVVCPSCSWRFAIGELDEVACPSCGVTLQVEDGAARLAQT